MANGIRQLEKDRSLLMAGGIVATHFTAMSAMTLVIPADTALRLPSADNSLQLGLTIAFITLLISGASISAAAPTALGQLPPLFRLVMFIFRVPALRRRALNRE